MRNNLKKDKESISVLGKLWANGHYEDGISIKIFCDKNGIFVLIEKIFSEKIRIIKVVHKKDEELDLFFHKEKWKENARWKSCAFYKAQGIEVESIYGKIKPFLYTLYKKNNDSRILS